MAELAIAAFVLSRVGEVQKHVTSVKDRIEEFKNNPKLYEASKAASIS